MGVCLSNKVYEINGWFLDILEQQIYQTISEEAVYGDNEIQTQGK